MSNKFQWSRKKKISSFWRAIRKPLHGGRHIWITKASMRGFFSSSSENGDFFLWLLFLGTKSIFKVQRPKKLTNRLYQLDFLNYSMLLWYIINKNYFFKIQIIFKSQQMNVFLKKVNFSVLWRQSQLFLLRVISLSFINGSLTLMAHFEPYTSQNNMEKPNDTHSIQKNYLEHVKPA